MKLLCPMTAKATKWKHASHSPSICHWHWLIAWDCQRNSIQMWKSQMMSKKTHKLANQHNLPWTNSFIFNVSILTILMMTRPAPMKIMMAPPAMLNPSTLPGLVASHNLSMRVIKAKDIPHIFEKTSTLTICIPGQCVLDDYVKIDIPYTTLTFEF